VLQVVPIAGPRICRNEDVALSNGLVVPRGTVVWPMLHIVHMHPDNWPDADRSAPFPRERIRLTLYVSYKGLYSLTEATHVTRVDHLECYSAAGCGVFVLNVSLHSVMLPVC
jgi:hypothetical protein